MSETSEGPREIPESFVFKWETTECGSQTYRTRH